jgi:hypothetical protein
VTTSSDRLLLRWVPLAALLAVVMAVGLSTGADPFGFHGWPKAPAPRSIDRVVRVVPRNAPVAIARREPASRPARHDGVAAPERGDDRATVGERPAKRAAPAPRRAPRHAPNRGRGSSSSPAPAEQPTPGHDGAGDGPADQAPDGSPVAQAPSPLPDAAEAKPQVRRMPAPERTVAVEPGADRAGDDYGWDGDEHRHRHGRGAHGHGHGGHRRGH